MESPRLLIVAKILGVLVLLANLAFHGLAALFIGGPFGLALYLVVFVGFWTTGWFALRRWHGTTTRTDGS